MPVFNKIFKLSKKTATSLLKNKSPKRLLKSDLFSDEDKAYILNELTNKEAIDKRQALLQQINQDADWQLVEKQITNPVRKLNWYYTAAAVLVAFLAVAYLIKQNYPSGEVPHIIVNNIETGSDKATLTLEDGTHVELGEGSSFQGENANSDGDNLVYKKPVSKYNQIAYNYLTIPRGGQFIVELSDGTKVWLNSESQLKYPVSFVDGDTRKVELVYGEAYFDVSSSTENKGSKFKVYNNKQEIKVLGTEFNVKAYKEEFNVYTTLVEGKVEVGIDDKKEVLKPSQQANLDLQTNSFKVYEVDVYNEISWREGIFSFENKSLKEIMTVLSRWYDTEVIFENKALENEEFIGVLGKNQNITEILNTIQNFGIISDYQINDKTIILK
ncbi:FecR family protein [Aestuariibaculum suncheonense]|uniref:FecR domain-containing protein n=1 Tax=Aestuariibaculum suncheonense TaxID=1028745 RepID=A0A8J6QMK8_9FLAO|nr:FecR family protein [Aestuariibaculum suncheonense]MBD0836796.1 FecR domain-containing protein [Aestuariibaculum suncheonense]